MQATVHPSAEAELGEQVLFYENRHPGKGLALLAAVNAVLDRIVLHPLLGQTVVDDPGGRRRVKLRRFPFFVIYRVAASVEVIAFAHTRRRERYWQDR